MPQLNLDLTGYEIREGFALLNKGWYEMEVEDAEIKEGKQGPYVQWRYGVVGYPNKIWDIMSFANEIAMSRMKTLASCCGHPNPNHLAASEDLYGKRFMGRVGVDDKNPDYEPKNKVTAFKSVDSDTKVIQHPAAANVVSPGQPATAAATPPPPQQTQPAEPARMPWEQ